MSIKVRCTHSDCGQSYKVTQEQLGRTVECQKCKRTFTLQASAPAPTQARSASEGTGSKGTGSKGTASEGTASDEGTPESAVPASPRLRFGLVSDQFPSPADSAAVPPPPPVAESQAPSGKKTSSVPAADMPEKLGRFEIQGRLGSGSFGAVYRAYDPMLDREVALKVPHASAVQSDTRRARVLTEAKAAAQLRHPNIVPVYEAGKDGDTYYIASAFIEGQTLEDALAAQKFDFRQAAKLVMDLAGALQYAHHRGVVHRDIKPANIMLDVQGDPLVMDFGLARLEAAESKLTHDGTVLGTPAYMPPEQASGQLDKVGPTSDQYSLGVVLYELLCGSTPFAGPATMVISLVVNQEPDSPRKTNPAITKDLETICLKAMSKKAEHRFASCQEMGEDLRRWLDGQPIVARRVSPAERLVRWCRRNPIMAGLAGSAACLLVLVAIIATVGYASTSRALGTAESERKRAEDALADANRQRTRANDERQRAEKQLLRSEWMLYALEIASANRAWENNDTAQAWRYLNACRWDFRGWEHDYLCTLFNQQQETLTLKGHDYVVGSVTFSPDGRRIVSASRSTAKVWDATTGHEILTLEGLAGVYSLCFSPDGRQLVAGCGDNAVKVLDATTGQEILTLKGHAARVRSVSFSPDGRRIVSASDDRTVRMWDATTGREMLILSGHTSVVTSVSVSPDGRRIVSGSSDKTVKVWDVAMVQGALTLQGHSGPVNSVAFSPDGRRIVSGSFDKMVKVWDAAKGQEILTLKGHTNIVTCVAFSPDGQRIVSGADDARIMPADNMPADKTLKVWDATTGQELLTLRGHSGGVTSVSFSPDDRRIVSGSRDKMVKVWDATMGQKVLTIEGHMSRIQSVSFSPDGERIVSGTGDAMIRVWNARTGQETLTLKGHTGVLGSASFSPDGQRIVSGAGDATIRIWNAATGEEISTIAGHTYPVSSVAFTPDGKQVVSASEEGTVKVWDVATGQKIATLADRVDPKDYVAIIGGSWRTCCVSVSPDGQRIVGAGRDGIKIWDTATGKEALTLEGQTLGAWGVAFSPDGRRIAGGLVDHTVKVWDAGTGKEALTLEGHTDVVRRVAFSPDGRQIVSGSDDTTLKLWDVTSGQVIVTLKGHTNTVTDVSFSPDGRHIVSGSEDQTVKVWDIATGQKQ